MGRLIYLMIRQRRLWLMPQELLMSCVVSKMWLNPLRRTVSCLNAKSRTCNSVWMKLRAMPLKEAEEIAALNLAKFRQAHSNLADAEERADLNEQALAKFKAKGRAGSVL